MAETLEGKGIEVILAPVLQMVPRAGPAPDLSDVQAILVTSANGAAAIGAALGTPLGRRDVPVLAVGDATAAAAAAQGFSSVTSAGAESRALAGLAMERLDPDAGVLLHASGATVAGALVPTLEAAGFRVRRAILYDMAPVPALSGAARAALAAGEIDGVLLFSPRSAEVFVKLARAAALVGSLESVAAYCLSKAVAAAAGTIAWRRVVVGDRPESAALIAAVAGAARRR
ncbi:MAG: uroporphyrinogen-III synthase [Alphaproteobacteria bacterium]|nr:uroporphyrinogen-III synthase [Alphaproteobacteria bacterium]